MFIEVTLYCLLAVVVVVLTLILLYSVYLYHEHRKYAHIPGPPLDNFFLGHLVTLKKVYEKGGYSHDLFKTWATEYGPVFKVFILHKCLLFPTSTAIIKEVLTKSKYPKAKKAYSMFHSLWGSRFLGTGLVTNTNHAKWYKRRRTIDPAFHKQNLSSLMGQFNEVGDSWIRKLCSYADAKESFSMSDLLCRVTLDTIGKLAFDLDINAIHDENNPFPKAIWKILEGMAVRAKDPFFRFRRGQQTFIKECCSAVEFLRNAGQRSMVKRCNQLQEGQSGFTDVLQYLLLVKQAIPELDLEDVLDDFVTLFVAGQETTSNTLSFMIGHLGRNPEVLNRLTEEIDSVLQGRMDVQYDDLVKLEYMNQIWKETLRLYPTAPGTGRETPTETVIDGIRFPAGSFVAISFYVTHRLPQYYSDPEEWDPDRWAPGQKHPLFAYMPFSIGQRSCPGQHFAKIESKVLLCKLLTIFNMHLTPGQSFEVSETTTLRPKDGIQMSLSYR